MSVTDSEQKAAEVLKDTVSKHVLSPDEQAAFLQMAQRMGQMSDEEKQELLRKLSPKGAQLKKPPTEIEKEQAERAVKVYGVPAPRTDDELWELIKSETGYEIPRVAVCPDHQAMFDPVADAYFNRERAILVIASRAAGKTIAVSIVHFINAITKPGIEGVTFGAILPQAKRAFGYIKQFIYTRDEEGSRVLSSEILGEPTREKIEWKSGSLLALLVGSKSGVNSPHPQVVHADEIDLMEEDILDEAANMSTSGKTIDGVPIPALDIGTTTRKSMKGLAQKLIDEIEEAEKNGYRPPRKLYVVCYKEIAAEVPHCRKADPVARVQRLVQLGRDPRELCQCQSIVKGDRGTYVDESGEEQVIPRTLESCCQGDLFKSRGWMPYDDIVGKFMNNSPAVWEAQMECRRPMADGLFLPSFSRDRHTVRGWVPRPEYGDLYLGVDWGGAAPSVVTFLQGPLRQPIQIRGYTGNEIVVPTGSIVAYDIIVAPPIGASKLADLVAIKEASWRRQFPGWRVRGRFADMAGRQQREDWHSHSPPLRTHWYVDRAFDHTVESLRDYVTDNHFYVDLETCSSLADDFESWRMKNGHEVHDESSHGPASVRYACANIRSLHRDQARRQNRNQVMPVIRERGMERQYALPVVGGVESPGMVSTSGVESEKWRSSFMPASSGNLPGENGWRTGI